MPQPKLRDFLKQNPGSNEKDYNTRYIGDYRGHHRKIKRMFYSNGIGKQRANQIDPRFGRLIISGDLIK